MRACVASVVLGVTLLCTASANAASNEGWYVGLGAGWTVMDPVQFGIAPPAGPLSGKATFSDAAAIDVDGGYRFPGLPIRAEGEFLYAGFNADNLKSGNVVLAPLHGNASVGSFLANAYYDYALTNHFAMTLGMGIGAANFDPNGITTAAGASVHTGATDFTWQGIIGVTTRLSDQWEVQVDYRYQSVEGSNHIFFNGANSVLAFKGKSINAAMVNLRWFVEG